MPLAATWTNLEMIVLSEVSQTKTISYITHMSNLIFKKWHKWAYLQNRLADFKHKLTVTKGKMGDGVGRDKLKAWGWHIHTSIYKMDN